MDRPPGSLFRAPRQGRSLLTVSGDINVLALVKGAERYVFLFDDASRGRNAPRLGPLCLESGIELHLVRRGRAQPKGPARNAAEERIRSRPDRSRASIWPCLRTRKRRDVEHTVRSITGIRLARVRNRRDRHSDVRRRTAQRRRPAGRDRAVLAILGRRAERFRTYRQKLSRRSRRI